MLLVGTFRHTSFRSLRSIPNSKCGCRPKRYTTTPEDVRRRQEKAKEMLKVLSEAHPLDPQLLEQLNQSIENMNQPNFRSTPSSLEEKDAIIKTQQIQLNALNALRERAEYYFVKLCK